ncbi:hypothetical protein OH77DRAFT_130059 [Trametes cingulata]|nr:hypothetical protein OH77DRAFT_130059 [Trametes cingulata]
MRLLNTSTGEFQWVNRPEDVRYAILSHVWAKSESGHPLEQSYQEVLALWKAAERRRSKNASKFDGGRPRQISILNDQGLSPKIREFCRIARKHGFGFGWADMCCIDKTSSAELSEAINSMYEWYSKASVCYAYLADVHEDPPADSRLSRLATTSFFSSEWHTRGWTLQELIAPKNVLFLSSAWSVIGSKASFARSLENAISVDEQVLRHEVSVYSISVARRMSWAAKRRTSRVEDEAYSLMGIFGVHIPTIYGEGRNAFKRLQEEIIRTVPDQSIFAWNLPGASAYSLPHTESRLTASWHAQWWDAPCGLLASSPMYFEHAGDVVPCTGEVLVRHLPIQWTPDGLPDIHCSFTSEGIRIELLCVELRRTSWAREDPDSGLIAMSIQKDTRAVAPVPTLESCSYDWSTCIEVLAFLRCVRLGGGPVALLLSSADGLDARKDQGLHARRQMRGSHRFSRTFILPSQMEDSVCPTPDSLARLVTVDISPIFDAATPQRYTPGSEYGSYEESVVSVPSPVARPCSPRADEIRFESWCVDALAADFKVLSSYRVSDNPGYPCVLGRFDTALRPRSRPDHGNGLKFLLVVTIDRDRLLQDSLLPWTLEVAFYAERDSTVRNIKDDTFDSRNIYVTDSDLLQGVELVCPLETGSRSHMVRMWLSGQIRTAGPLIGVEEDEDTISRVLWLVLEPLEYDA